MITQVIIIKKEAEAVYTMPRDRSRNVCACLAHLPTLLRRDRVLEILVR